MGTVINRVGWVVVIAVLLAGGRHLLPGIIGYGAEQRVEVTVAGDKTIVDPAGRGRPIAVAEGRGRPGRTGHPGRRREGQTS